VGFPLFVWNKLFLILLGFCSRNYGNNALVVATFFEIDNSVDQSIECIILTDTNIVARIMFCATLTNNDVASYYFLATPNLNA
jgi:hypothetical protein